MTFPDGLRRRRPGRQGGDLRHHRQALKRAVVPAADDELAKKIGFEGLDDLTAALKRRYPARARPARPAAHQAPAAGRAGGAGRLRGAAGHGGGRVRPDLAARRGRPQGQGKVDEDDAGKDDETLKAEYRAIAERRVRLGLLLAEIGRANGITVAPDELTRAMRAEAARYPGQEQKVMEFFRKNPQAAERLRGPIFEEKVVDFVLELAKVTDSTVTAGGTGPRARRRRPRPAGGPPGEWPSRPAADRPAAADPAPLLQSRGADSDVSRAGVAAPHRGRPAAWKVGQDEGSRSRRDLQQHPGADGGRADRPRRAGLRHLFAAAEGADHLPDRRGVTTRSPA